MKFTLEEFRAWEHKRVTLVGMSGVGKSYLSAKLRGNDWFHYSGDYRIGTRYLDEHIIDMIKQQAIKIPFLKELLRNDWMSYILQHFSWSVEFVKSFQHAWQTND